MDMPVVEEQVCETINGDIFVRLEAGEA